MNETIIFPNLHITLENVGKTFTVFGIDIAYYGLIIAIGMLLGVPVFVVIYAGLEKLVNDGLKKRGLQTETAEYMDLDYIDDATMRPVRLPKEAPPESLKDTQDGSVK